MKLLLAACAALTSLAAAETASAQAMTDTSVYGSVGYTRLDGDDSGLDGITGRVGVRFMRFVGIEGEFTQGIGSESFDDEDVDVDIELSKQFGAYVVGAVPITPNAEVFARVGYARLTLDAEVKALGESVNISGRGSGPAFGVGASFFFDGVNGVRGDYTRIEFSGDEEDEDNVLAGGAADLFSISYIRRF